jgi:hypothetical protein
VEEEVEERVEGEVEVGVVEVQEVCLPLPYLCIGLLVELGI